MSIIITRKGMSIIITKIEQFQEALLALSTRNSLKEHLAWIRSCAPGIILATKNSFCRSWMSFGSFDYGNARDVLLVLGFKTFLRTNILSVILFNDIFPDKCLFWYLSCTKLTFSCLFYYGSICFFQLVVLMLGSISTVPNLLGTQSWCCIADEGLLLLHMLYFPNRRIH